jgi:hypothetical protein
MTILKTTLRPMRRKKIEKKTPHLCGMGEKFMTLCVLTSEKSATKPSSGAIALVISVAIQLEKTGPQRWHKSHFRGLRLNN